MTYNSMKTMGVVALQGRHSEQSVAGGLLTLVLASGLPASQVALVEKYHKFLQLLFITQSQLID